MCNKNNWLCSSGTGVFIQEGTRPVYIYLCGCLTDPEHLGLGGNAIYRVNDLCAYINEQGLGSRYDIPIFMGKILNPLLSQVTCLVMLSNEQNLLF